MLDYLFIFSQSACARKGGSRPPRGTACSNEAPTSKGSMRPSSPVRPPSAPMGMGQWVYMWLPYGPGGLPYGTPQPVPPFPPPHMVSPMMMMPPPRPVKKTNKKEQKDPSESSEDCASNVLHYVVSTQIHVEHIYIYYKYIIYIPDPAGYPQ